MLFEIIDQKQNCKSIYSDSKIHVDPDYSDLSMTWAYNTVLKDYDIQYALI